ncbi:hypothetical protein GUJ93_ZPchr0001g33223 [Zizania palustris]|uniref:Uncharacterized protein n=1 Tax=Zizania palustris TaxID=103762 RepID=A0A8J5RX91_ZIZPA|nr:hypothetical protein GUJ93_ZPchr0001g33223 [Zizania palustris]
MVEELPRAPVMGIRNQVMMSPVMEVNPEVLGEVVIDREVIMAEVELPFQGLMRIFGSINEKGCMSHTTTLRASQ